MEEQTQNENTAAVTVDATGSELNEAQAVTVSEPVFDAGQVIEGGGFTFSWVFPAIIILVLIFLWAVVLYNSFVKGRIRVKEAWADIEVQLKRRYNLIPNLVESVKGYLRHEKGVLENVTKARAEALKGQGSPASQAQTENMLTDALKSLFAVAENYPDLKANQNFLDLQAELTDTEDKIQAARRFFNGVTRDYNTGIALFPHRIIARLFGFKPEEFFETEGEKEREVVEVKF